MPSARGRLVACRCETGHRVRYVWHRTVGPHHVNGKGALITCPSMRETCPRGRCDTRAITGSSPTWRLPRLSEDGCRPGRPAHLEPGMVLDRESMVPLRSEFGAGARCRKALAPGQNSAAPRALNRAVWELASSAPAMTEPGPRPPHGACDHRNVPPRPPRTSHATAAPASRSPPQRRANVDHRGAVGHRPRRSRPAGPRAGLPCPRGRCGRS